VVRTIGDVRHRRIIYSPLPSQKSFHNSSARFKGFSGPVGSGKSQALCHEAIRLSAPTYPMLRDATLASFTEILASNRIPYDFNKSDSVLMMKETGSRILFRSIENFEYLRGTNLAWFGVDELTYGHEQAWLRLEGRLRDPLAKRLCGFAVWTPKGFDWVYKRFIRNRVDGYETILAKPYENRHLLDRVPDFYERLKSSYDPVLFEQEALGQYMNLNAGAVYGSFQRDRNVHEQKLNRSMPICWALDFNVDPMSSLVVQKLGEQVHVLDEIVLSRASTEEACEEFQGRFPNHQAGIIIYGDASGARLQTAGTTDYKIIREYFRAAGYQNIQFRVPPGNPHVRLRVDLTNGMLLSASGDVKLQIDPRCKGLIQDFEEVTYKPDSRIIDKDRDPKRTHLSDALGYLLWQECRARGSFGEQSRPLF
jgi:hypothetical protein